VHLTKDFDQIVDVSLRRRLESDLALAALIIAQLKIRRAGDHALDALVTHWKFLRIATNDHRFFSACRAQVLKAPGVYSALAGGAAQRENTGVRFRDVPERFFPARR
jgi:hypothetical protein